MIPPHPPRTIIHKETPDSDYEILTPEEHRLRHCLAEYDEDPLYSIIIIEAYLIKDIERAKLDYHKCWGDCPEDGTEVHALENALKIVREARRNPKNLAKRGLKEGWL